MHFYWTNETIDAINIRKPHRPPAEILVTCHSGKPHTAALGLGLGLGFAAAALADGFRESSSSDSSVLSACTMGGELRGLWKISSNPIEISFSLMICSWSVGNWKNAFINFMILFVAKKPPIWYLSKKCQNKVHFRKWSLIVTNIKP